MQFVRTSHPVPQYWCTDCEEFRRVDAGIGRKYCILCAKELEPRIIQDLEERPNPDVNNLLEFLGEDFHALIEQSMNEQSPSRQISRTYLATLGKVVVDERLGILHDISIDIGPLKLMAIPATFGGLPLPEKKITSSIVIGNPECGETPFTNKTEMNGALVFLSRGKVSFATKAKYAIEAGASAVIIAQTMDIWPFIMCDSSNEFNLPIEVIDKKDTPVLMISKRDSVILQKILLQNILKCTPSIAHINCYFSSEESCECCICKEDMAVGTEVLKLHCRHIYHTTCVEAWLESQNTCPMCRTEMPIDENPKPTKASSSSEQYRMPYFT